MDIEGVEPQAKVPTLIRLYGEFWNPDWVDWENSYELLGKRNKGPRSPNLNVYEERGIYVLYKDYAAVYVGEAIDSSIGSRLQAHRTSRRKGPRWDSFSWFGLMGLDERTQEARKPRGKRHRLHVDHDVLIKTLEALLITVIDPRLNSRKERMSGAERLFQSDADAPPDSDKRLAQIERKLDELRNHLVR